MGVREWICLHPGTGSSAFLQDYSLHGGMEDGCIVVQVARGSALCISSNFYYCQGSAQDQGGPGLGAFVLGRLGKMPMVSSSNEFGNSTTFGDPRAPLAIGRATTPFRNFAEVAPSGLAV